MSIGNKPVYPIPLTTYQDLGLTYREWLIGMLASNYWVFEPSSSKEPEKRIIDTADAIINQLDKEAK